MHEIYSAVTLSWTVKCCLSRSSAQRFVLRTLIGE